MLTPVAAIDDCKKLKEIPSRRNADRLDAGLEVVIRLSFAHLQGIAYMDMCIAAAHRL